MDTNQWAKIEAILDHVLDLPQEERQNYINTICNQDTTLYKQVVEYLDAIDESERTHFLHDISAQKEALIKDIPNIDAQNDFVGRRIGAFKIIEKIGTGGMGAVFKAVRIDGKFEQQVAIKFVHQGFYPEQVQKRFEMERQILAKLNHPNIARLYDGGITDDGNPYLIMEYIEGIPIDEYCNHHKLTITERLQLFSEACQAIEFAHQNLIVHRDLKAQNIYVTQPGLVKILDFGIAKLLDPELTAKELITTQPGQHFWTPHYAAPEQIEGESITTATDVYALGILLHKLITDQFPFDFTGKSLTQIRAMIAAESPNTLVQSLHKNPSLKKTAGLRSISVQSLRKTAVGDLSAITKKATRQMVAYRYDSVSKLREDIQNYRNNLPVSAKQDTFLYRINKFFRRHKNGILTAACIFLALVGLISYYTVQLTKKEKQAALEAKKAQQVTDYMVGLFKLADPNQNVKDTLTVFDLLRLGKENIDKMQDQPAMQVQMLLALGGSYKNIGDYEEAEYLYKKADSLSNQLYEPNSLEVANVAFSLGSLNSMERAFTNAKQYFQKAQPVYENLPDRYWQKKIALWEKYGNTLQELDKPDSAAFFINKALRLQEQKKASRVSIISTKLHLAKIYRAQKKYDESEKIYRNILNWLTHSDVSNNDLLATTLNNLAYLLKDEKRYAEAETLYKRSLVVHEEVYGKDHPTTLMILSNLAVITSHEGKHHMTEELLRQKTNLTQKRYGENHWRTGSSYMGLGIFYFQTHQFEKAGQNFNKGYIIYLHALGKNHTWSAVACLYTYFSLKNIPGQNPDTLYKKGFDTLQANKPHFSRHDRVDIEKLIDLVHTYSAKALPKKIASLKKLLTD